MRKIPARGPMRSGARLRMRYGPVGTRSDTKLDAVRNGLPGGRKNETLIAVLGILATTVAAVTGSVTTYLSSSSSIESAARQSAAEFRKDQQRTAYTTFLVEYSKMNLTGEQVINQLRQAVYGVPISIKELQAEHNLFIGQWSKVRDAAIPVALVQSVDLQKATKPFGEALDELRASVLGRLLDAQAGRVRQSDVDALLRQMQDVNARRSNVLDLARRDLGFEPTE